MAIPTSRTREPGVINIYTDRCNGCGLCVSVCSDGDLIIKDGVAAVSDKYIFGCIACGHCMAVCPQDAIFITGREFSSEDLFDLPDKENATDYKKLLNLMKRRRSVRKFQDRPVEKEVIDKIIEAASYSPVGIPPSDVRLVVFDSAEKLNGFVKDFCIYLEKMKRFMTGWVLRLMRPFMKKEMYEYYRDFVSLLILIYLEGCSKGENYVTYDAPLAIYFYGSPYSDPADPVIAATAAMYAGESLGLGTCMIGAIHPFIQNGAAKWLREKYGIKYKSTGGIFVIFGYPVVKYRKGVRRDFAEIIFSE
ncbi:MAG: nitroreductase family protein [Bacteroidales bacterium]